MIKKLIRLAVFIIPMYSFSQMVYNFDVAPDTSFWAHEISEAADSTLSYTNLSLVTDLVSEGSGSMQIDYSAHNIETWGGYAKTYHLHPDIATGGTYDWSGYDTLSIDY